MKIPNTFTIESNNLKLRQPILSDLPEVFSATQVPGFNDGMIWNAPDKESDLHEFFHQSIDLWEKGTSYCFTIQAKASDLFYGRISIRKGEDPAFWNIGFWTHPRYQSQGIMTEAAAAILDFGFNDLSAEQIEAAHALWNIASRKVLEKIGMKFVKHLPQGFQKNGVWIAEDLLCITKVEWQKLCKTM